MLRHIGTYDVESLQIYFPASLELQEELIKAGFKVPKPTPLPIVYANFRGWVAEKPPITIERLIHPLRYGKSPLELGWRETVREGKEGYIIPDEKSILNVKFDDERSEVHLIIKPETYHIERTSIRQIGPEKWTNWAMFYLNLKDMVDLTQKFLEIIKLPLDICDKAIYVKKETLQGGREETYFCCLDKDSEGIPVKDFSFCMGCFDQVIDYLANEVKSREVVNTLKLRLNYSSEVRGFAKIGLARIKGKNPQFMFKLASYPIKKVIKGILKGEIQGKARGNLSYCNHKEKNHYIILDSTLFLRALCCSRNIFYGITLENRDCKNCYIKFRKPTWFGQTV